MRSVGCNISLEGIRNETIAIHNAKQISGLRYFMILISLFKYRNQTKDNNLWCYCVRFASLFCWLAASPPPAFDPSPLSSSLPSFYCIALCSVRWPFSPDHFWTIHVRCARSTMRWRKSPPTNPNERNGKERSEQKTLHNNLCLHLSIITTINYYLTINYFVSVS